ncbi:ribosomal protein S18-alanine N-acetyltransferase [Clostridium sp.]|uniref:ribosomal protein S18-alanine N-acetyltransferase n=1 Tax=Clostridium sp. TaxID=1506 RepID=UPI002FDC98AC
MNDIEISSLKTEHIDTILLIDTLCFPVPWSRESFKREIEGNTLARYVIAKSSETIVGYAGMWLILDEAHITTIAVHPKYRRIGAGNLLLESLIEICKIESINSMTLEVRKSNITAQKLYKKHGFIESGIRKAYYGDNKEDAIIMWKYHI